MTRKLLLFFLSIAAVFIFACFSEGGYPANYPNVRVCVRTGEDRLSLMVKGPYTIKAINSDITLDKKDYLNREAVLPTNSGLKLGEQEFRIYGIRVIPEKEATIFVDRMRFRGVVDILRTKELKLLVINHLDIEKYLYGVLYHETPHYWPAETLKAQAIVARTFALCRIKELGDRDYDVTSDIYSQVYGGRASERRKTTLAVDATRGKILTYNGKILPSYYHSMCAGHTEDAGIVFDRNLPPLAGRPCPYCEGAPHMTWKAQFSYKQMEERLNNYGVEVKGMNFIIEGKRDKSGRLESVKIRDKKGVREIKGYVFRLAVGPNVIKSTNFTVDITTRGVIFRGKGWGHGVGMCQWGAFGMAKRRFNYKQILEFYYPGAKISTIEDEL